MSESTLLTLPVVCTRGMIVFPGNRLSLDVGRPLSLKALELSSRDFDNNILFVSQINPIVDDPKYDDVYNEPVYFDASNCSSNTDHHYFFTTDGRGESVICHLGYVVDEDMLGQIYMDTDYSDEMKLIDVRK